MEKLNIANLIPCTEVEGPGQRFAIWVQGCLLQCRGCCNKGMQPLEPRSIIEATEVVSLIKGAMESYVLEGVTFLGGEPMLQAKGLSLVAEECQKLGLSVMTFTGYTMEQLKEMKLSGIESLLEHTDILVDGAFLLDSPERERNWVGSTNQVIHFLSNRYPAGIEYDSRYTHAMEVRIGDNGEILANGYPIFDFKNHEELLSKS